MVNISGIIKSIQNIMRQDKGLNGDAQRIEQLGWMLFLKIFDDKDIEIVIVDNGSNDDTQEVLAPLLEKYTFVTLVNVSVNKGYGYGILEGLKGSSGVILGWTHADLQTDPGDIVEALKFFEECHP